MPERVQWRTELVDEIANMIVGSRRHPLGIAGLMLDAEERAGRTIVPVGSYLPFPVPAADWVAPTVISVANGEVRIVAILAKQQGNGAFRRLVDGIVAAGLRPVVVEPVGETMPAIMKRWNWRRRIRGTGFERFEEWRPRSVTTPEGSP